MKRVILGLLLLIALVMATACGSSTIEDKAIDSFKASFDNYKAGVFEKDELDEILGSLGEMGYSDEASENFIQTIKNIFKAMTYDVKSCVVDDKNENLYIINVDIKTVNGAAIFLSDVAIEVLVDVVFELAQEGETDLSVLMQAGLDAFVKEILKASQSAKADKTVNIDFKAEYNPETKTFTAVTDDWALQMIGLNENFADDFEEKVDKMLNDKFDL